MEEFHRFDCDPLKDYFNRLFYDIQAHTHAQAVKRVPFPFFLVFVFGSLRMDSCVLRCGLSGEDVDEVIIEENWKSAFTICRQLVKFLSRNSRCIAWNRTSPMQDTQSAAAPAEALAKAYINEIASALRSQSELSDSMAKFSAMPTTFSIVQENWMNTKCEWRTKPNTMCNLIHKMQRSGEWSSVKRTFYNCNFIARQS